MNPFLSVIICTHNPRDDYLKRVLISLEKQALPVEQWELLLIDNASSNPLSTIIDLSWHPQARHVREEELGLTPARLRGILESKADVLVFVDDDNVLDADYLETALTIAKNWMMIGVWGGQTRPSFEAEPPEWTRLYWGNLAIREFEGDRWSNIPYQSEALPCGAGMCMRRAVAEAYSKLVVEQPERMRLGRRGNALTSSEDTDIAMTACGIGYGMGLFSALRLTHIIPPTRLQEDYLLRLEEGLAYSGVMLAWLNGTLQKRSWRTEAVQFCRRWFMDARTRLFHDAFQRGAALALREIAKFDA